MKILALYWLSDKIVSLRKVKFNDGIIKIGKKTFQVDKSQPYFFKTGGLLRGGVSPIYILKHNSPYPLVMPAMGKLQYSSENITNLLELKTLDNILNVPGAKKMDTIMFLLIGVAIGALVSAVLFLTHVIGV